MLLFSATFEDSVWQFAERIIPDPNVIKLRKEELTLNNIQQYYVLCGNRKDKYQALCNIYGGITIGQAIIFCQVTPLGLAFLMRRLPSSWGQGTESQGAGPCVPHCLFMMSFNFQSNFE